MFKKKKLYKITYTKLGRYSTIVAGRNEFHALRKLKKELRPIGNIYPSIVSIEEYKLEKSK